MNPRALFVLLLLGACVAPGDELGSVEQANTAQWGGTGMTGEVVGFLDYADHTSAMKDWIFHRALDGHVHAFTRGAVDTWGPWSWMNVTAGTAYRAPYRARFTANISAIDASPMLFFRTTTNHIVRMKRSGKVWAELDLASDAAGDPILAGAIVGQSIFYRTTSNHIKQMSWNAFGQLSSMDLTAIAGAPVAQSDPTMVHRPDGYDSVVYQSASGITEMYSFDGTSWGYGFPGLLAGQPLHINPPPRPFGYIREDDTYAIVYRDPGAISELRLTATGWVWSNLTAGLVTGSLFPAGEPTAIHNGADGDDHIYYRAWNNRIVQLTSHLGAPWQLWNLTDPYGAAPALGDPSVYNSIASDHEAVLFPIADNHAGDLAHHYESTQIPAGWTAHDLTAMSGEVP